MRRAGIVLCGGLSSRMGSPKALLTWRGRTMIEHTVATLHECVDEIVVVTSGAFELPELPARIVRDREPKRGPLMGMREGLEAIGSEFAFATGVDAPFLNARFIETMFSFGGTAAPVVDGYVQPLAAVYAQKLANVASELIAANRMRLIDLLEAAHYRQVRPEELPDLASLTTFNTPEDYARAVQAQN